MVVTICVHYPAFFIFKDKLSGYNQFKKVQFNVSENDNVKTIKTIHCLTTDNCLQKVNM